MTDRHIRACGKVSEGAPVVRLTPATDTDSPSSCCNLRNRIPIVDGLGSDCCPVCHVNYWKNFVLDPWSELGNIPQYVLRTVGLDEGEPTLSVDPLNELVERRTR